MNLAEIINVNSPGISPTAFGFFTAILGFLVTMTKLLLEAKKDAREARIKAAQATKGLETVQENTKNIGNGFASNVDQKLEIIDRRLDELVSEQAAHYQWHLHNEGMYYRGNVRKQEQPQHSEHRTEPSDSIRRAGEEPD